jgi:hypothetical protein
MTQTHAHAHTPAHKRMCTQANSHTGSHTPSRHAHTQAVVCKRTGTTAVRMRSAPSSDEEPARQQQQARHVPIDKVWWHIER